MQYSVLVLDYLKGSGHGFVGELKATLARCEPNSYVGNRSATGSSMIRLHVGQSLISFEEKRNSDSVLKPLIVL